MIFLATGDAMTLAPLRESEVIDSIVTSPPYWGLREYGDNDCEVGGHGQDLDSYLDDMSTCAKTWVSRMAPTGTLWLVMSDTACVDEETEIFTRRGWLSVGDLEDGDETLTLNPRTRQGEWQKILDVHWYPGEPRKMLSMEGDRGHSSLTTPNHRWFVESRSTTMGVGSSRRGEQNGFAVLTLHDVEAIRAAYGEGQRQVDLAARFGVTQTAVSKIVTGRTWSALPVDSDRTRSWLRQVVRSDELKTDSRVPVSAKVVNLPKSSPWSDSLVELVAWYWTEGNDRSLYEGAKGIWITQSERVNGPYCDRIRRCLSDLFGDPVDRMRGKSRWSDVPPPPQWREDRSRVGIDGLVVWKLNGVAADVIRHHAPGKVVSPSWLVSLTQEQLDLFVSTSIDADGCWGDTGAELVQSNVGDGSVRAKMRSDAFHFAVTLSGRYATLRSVNRGGDSRPNWLVSSAPHHGWAVWVGSKRYFKPGRARQEWIVFDGPVWCPTTLNGSWLARRKGAPFFTGNSGSGGAGGDYNAGGTKQGARKWRQGESGLPKKTMCGVPHKAVDRFVAEGWILRQTVIWVKPSPARADPLHERRPLTQHEYIFLLVPEADNRRKLIYPWQLDEVPEARGSVWSLPVGRKVPHGHPAPFPDELVARCVRLTTKPGDTVLDPFCGSGTTPQVAHQLGRRGIGIDLYRWW